MSEQRAINLRNAIGSLNSELRDTNLAVERAHDIKEALLAEVEQLLKDKETLVRDTTELRSKVPDLKRQIEELAKSIAILEQEGTDKEAKLNILIKNKEIELFRLNQDVEKIQASYTEYEEQLSNKLLELKKTEKALGLGVKLVRDVEKSLTIGQAKLQQIADKNDKEAKSLKEVRLYIKTYTKDKQDKIDVQEKNINALRKDYESKHKDLRIIRARLKKIWPKERPFPKLDW